MTFDFGNVNVGVMNNAGRDMTISGNQKGRVVVAAAVRQALSELRAAVASADLPGDAAETAQTELDDVSAAIEAAEPNPPRAARALERLTKLLTSVGALTTAGSALVGPLQTLGNWLGPLGAQLLALLPK